MHIFTRKKIYKIERGENLNIKNRMNKSNLREHRDRFELKLRKVNRVNTRIIVEKIKGESGHHLQYLQELDKFPREIFL